VKPRREVTTNSPHALDRFRLIDPDAGRFDVLAEANRGVVLDQTLALAVLGRVNPWSPPDGYILHRHGHGIFACVTDRFSDDRLHCVTFLRLQESQREILAGLWSPSPGDRGRSQPAAAVFGSITRAQFEVAMKGIDRGLPVRVRIGDTPVAQLRYGELFIPPASEAS
jgi:hypothetical protein